MIPYPLQEKFSPLVGYTEGKRLRQRWDFIFYLSLLGFLFLINFSIQKKKRKKERKKKSTN